MSLKVNPEHALQSNAIQARAFYGNETTGITNGLTAFEGKIRTEKPVQRKSRILSQPYSAAGSSTGNINTGVQSPAPTTQSNAVKYGTLPVTCTIQMVSIDRFEVLPSKFHGPVIDVFKTIPTRRYGKLIQ